MKIIIFSCLIIFYNNAIASPCNSAVGKYHVNPDGSNGGFIQSGARVPKSAYISTDSEICDKVIIEGTSRVEAGSRIGENVVIQGDSKIIDSYIYGNARISGRAIIEKSEICQSSLIEGIKVINSKYYCQTEDPAPKHPGDAGKKTLLGIDSDGDGVRDDIEIYINNSIPNTAKKDKAEERIATKILANMFQKEFLLKGNDTKILEILDLKLELYSCFTLDQSENLYAENYNTEERLLTLFKIAGVSHGKSMPSFKIKCKDLDSFISRLNKLQK